MTYIIGKIRQAEGFTLFLGRVNKRSGGIVEGYIEKQSHLKSKRALFEIPVKDIVLDLGEAPLPGKVYGFDTTNLYTNKVIEHDFFGQLHFFYKIKKEAGQALMAAFDVAAKRLTKLGFTPMQDCVWLIQHPETSGKYAGFFKYSKNTEKAPHTLAIKPEILGTSEMVYVIAHEFAHYVHSTMLVQPKINATWIRLFNTSIKVKTVKKEQSSSLLELLLEGEERPTDFRSGLDEEQRNSWNWIMRTIKQDHALAIDNLDTLFEAGEKEEIRRLWPVRTLHQKDLAPVISEYATVSYRETFAEAFAFHVVKKKLPEKVTALVEKSIQMAKSNQPKE